MAGTTNAAAMAQVQEALAGQLMNAAKIVESQIDEEMSKLENLDEDDLEAIRRRRMEAMKKSQEKKQTWLQHGHGKYEEIPEEKEFFNVTRNSDNVVCHFYRQSTFRCKIFDKHLEILANKHLETKFCKIDAEKCPFLTDRLKIRVIPTLCLVKNAKTKDFIVGFTDLGNTDEFSTEMLEWRLGCAELLNYAGDLSCPPDEKRKTKKINIVGKSKKTSKSIRGRDDDGDSSDENDW